MVLHMYDLYKECGKSVVRFAVSVWPVVLTGDAWKHNWYNLDISKHNNVTGFKLHVYIFLSL